MKNTHKKDEKLENKNRQAQRKTDGCPKEWIETLEIKDRAVEPKRSVGWGYLPEWTQLKEN